MDRSDLEEKLTKKIKEELFGEKKSKTLEQVLQEALDNTTPEEPGRANKEDPTPPRSEWI